MFQITSRYHRENYFGLVFSFLPHSIGLHWCSFHNDCTLRIYTNVISLNIQTGNIQPITAIVQQETQPSQRDRATLRHVASIEEMANITRGFALWSSLTFSRLNHCQCRARAVDGALQTDTRNHALHPAAVCRP